MKTDLLLKAGLGPLLAEHPLLCLDVGSRGGVEADLLPIAAAVDAVGFEPEPEAFAAVAGKPGPWRSFRQLPHALAGTEGPRVLHVPEAPEGASLLCHDPDLGRLWGKEQYFTIQARHTVQTRTLDAVLAEAGLAGAGPAYLKLDVEGAEMEILEGAPQTLAGLLAVKMEVAFIAFRSGQPLAAEILSFMRAKGFVLMDMMAPHHWRVQGTVTHPQAARQIIPYSRGQLVQGDYLFFRDPSAIDDPERRLQAAALAMAYGYFDHALGLLDGAGMSGAEALVDRCSRVYGRAVWVAEMRRHLRLFVTYGRSFLALEGGGR